MSKINVERKLRAFTPISKLDCTIPVNSNNYDSQFCGFSAGVEEVLSQGKILVANLKELKEDCERRNHKDCECTALDAKLAVMEAFLGL